MNLKNGEKHTRNALKWWHNYNRINILFGKLVVSLSILCLFLFLFLFTSFFIRLCFIIYFFFCLFVCLFCNAKATRYIINTSNVKIFEIHLFLIKPYPERHSHSFIHLKIETTTSLRNSEFL